MLETFAALGGLSLAEQGCKCCPHYARLVKLIFPIHELYFLSCLYAFDCMWNCNPFFRLAQNWPIVILHYCHFEVFHPAWSRRVEGKVMLIQNVAFRMVFKPLYMKFSPVVRGKATFPWYTTSMPWVLHFKQSILYTTPSLQHLPLVGLSAVRHTKQSLLPQKAGVWGSVEFETPDNGIPFFSNTRIFIHFKSGSSLIFRLISFASIPEGVFSTLKMALYCFSRNHPVLVFMDFFFFRSSRISILTL